MQYVGQTSRTLQKLFGEHYRRITKPKNIDTFLPVFIFLKFSYEEHP